MPHGAPDEFLGHIIVIATVHIADGHDRAPRQMGMTVAQSEEEVARRLGNNFERARDRTECAPAGLEALERQSGDKLLGKLAVVSNIEYRIAQDARN